MAFPLKQCGMGTVHKTGNLSASSGDYQSSQEAHRISIVNVGFLSTNCFRQDQSDLCRRLTDRNNSSGSTNLHMIRLSTLIHMLQS